MKWGEDKERQAVELYEGGLCIREVSEKTGIPQRTVHKILVDNGVERRKVTNNGYKWTDERRAAYSMMLKGRLVSDETKRKISDARKCCYNGLNGYGHLKPHNGGYILAYCPLHPNAHADGYVMFHTVIVERELGRYLTDDEVVHHINRIRDDNRPENLLLMTKKEHMSMHMRERHQIRREAHE